MLSSLLLFVVVLGSSAAKDVDFNKLYQETLRKYHKTPQLFLGNGDGNEHFQVFKKHAAEVFVHNDEADKEWEAEINEFALETEGELQSHLGLNMSDFTPSEAEISLQQTRPVNLMAAELPDFVDYTDIMTEVKNQGCGNCWAFGANAALEYQVNKDRKGEKKELSEQQYTNCVYNRDGCMGGWPGDCYRWSLKHQGHLASAASYPNLGTYGSCSYEDKKNALSGWKFDEKDPVVYVQGDSNLKAAVADRNIGVLVVAIAVTSDFFSYKVGLYSSKKCGANKVSVNHAVNVVGYGDDNGALYWIVRNSWGKQWGQNGYIKMRRSEDNKKFSNMCQISSYAHYPVIAGSDTEQESDEREEEEEKEESEEESAEWCMIENKELSGYATGKRVAMGDLDTAKSACGAMLDCKGLTTEEDEFTLRSGSDLVDHEGSTTYIPGDCPKICNWEKVDNRKMKGVLTKLKLSMEKAKAACEERDDCKGIHCKSAKKCALVSSSNEKKSKKYDSYIMSCQ
ncbi:pro-cathepsin H-like [Bolinopsis microptera]|uniref:pro-cathepsin H-like n=1 Tax=Bolinopsis microptera TaxID=2820187 RepID=UPI00307A95DA